MEKPANTRRRRLVERGSDRLAFITGQTRSLSCDPIPGSPLSAAVTPTPLSEQQKVEGGIASDPVPEFRQADIRRENKTKSLSLEDELFLKFKTGSAVPEIQPLNEGPLHRRDQETINEAPLHRLAQEATNKKTSQDGAPSIQPREEMEIRPRSAPASESNQSDGAGWTMETLKEHLNFTPREITQAISATESNRFLASIAIAFLVVLSNWGLDIGGTITRILVGTRPLLFLIITDITIVLTLLMENKDPNATGRPVANNMGSVDTSLQMLEIGLLLQKALGALLIDCSVCAVIMICFLGF